MQELKNAFSGVWGVVPAAGFGRRMGCLKQTLTYQGTTMASIVVRTLLDAGVCRVAVVTRSEVAGALSLPRDPRIDVALNDEPASTMMDSIRIGIGLFLGSQQGEVPNDRCSKDARPFPDRPPAPGGPGGADGFLVVPADMPALTTQACRLCIEAFARDPERIVIAGCKGRRGHPIIFPRSMCTALASLPHGLNDLPKRFPQRVLLVETGDDGVLRDVDTPDDLAAL